MSELTTRKVAFNKLPPEARERFVACTCRQSDPEPILAEQLGMGLALTGWGLLLLCGAGGLGFLLLADFGRVWGDLGMQSPAFIAAYALAIFVTAYSLLAILRRKRLLASLPFKPGRYLFPMDFVDARSDQLRIVPMATMVDFSGVHHHTNGVYTNTIFTFKFEGGISETMTIAGKAQAEAALEHLRVAQGMVATAIEERDIEALFVQDVFFHARVEGWEQEPKPFQGEAAPEGPSARPLPGWLARASLASLLGAAVLAAPVWYLRSYLSDEAIYAGLKRNGSEDMVASYVAHGGRHAAEAQEELLPVAALREAKQAATVTALREVVRKYPDADAATEARAEITQLFAKTVADFRRQAATDSPEMMAVMERLFVYLEENGSPPLEVRFGTPSASDLEAADQVLDKLAGGKAVPIRGHFDQGSSAPREQAIVRYLQDAFSAIFPADILSLEQGARIDLAGGEGKGATLDIDYDISPSGDIYVEDGTDRKFVGILVKFDVAMRVPGQAEVFRFTLTVEPPEHFTVSESPLGNYGLGNTTVGTSAGAVYRVMAERAFGELATKLRAVFFKPGADLDTPVDGAERPGARSSL